MLDWVELGLVTTCLFKTGENSMSKYCHHFSQFTICILFQVWFYFIFLLSYTIHLRPNLSSFVSLKSNKTPDLQRSVTLSLYPCFLYSVIFMKNGCNTIFILHCQPHFLTFSNLRFPSHIFLHLHPSALSLNPRTRRLVLLSPLIFHESMFTAGAEKQLPVDQSLICDVSPVGLFSRFLLPPRVAADLCWLQLTRV